jgi:hypothetical protein
MDPLSPSLQRDRQRTNANKSNYLVTAADKRLGGGPRLSLFTSCILA